jgi:HEAT repeat protein
MSAPSNHSPDFLLQTFLILQAIFRRQDNPQIQLKADRLYLDDQELITPGVALSEEQLKDRVRELARRLGLFSVSPQSLAQIWKAELTKRPRRARELIERGQVAAFQRKPHEIDLVKRWRDEFMPSLVHQLPSLDAVERFDESATQHDWENRFNLGPILEDWPRRILEDPFWKYAEAPMPDMEPLALDDVWVDLYLSDPLEGPEEERLPEHLELRNEQQRWVTEPAAFVLERSYGATAIIGPPGCGKTTLLKWFARQMISNPHGRFLLPLFVPLRKYARTRAGDTPGSAGTLLEFALRQCGITHPAQLRMWTTTINYLTGGDRTRVLIMLDGWDEVPVEHRDLLLKEIDDLAYSFSILISSRPSGFPRMLPVSHFYEIASLSHDNSERLIRRWFATIGAPDQAEALLRRLDDHPDLRRLARNPFLLSLLCVSSRWWTEDSAVSRTSLYRQAISLIVAHHNRHHPRTITSVDQRNVERLALWLQADVPNAPRYVFDRADAQACLNETATLEAVLPSRLLSQLRLDQESFHFLHTTFQEYLAARGLLAESPAGLQQRMLSRSYDLSWQEILCFAAGEADDEKLKAIFWQRLAEMAQQPDRFGLIFPRLARFIIEAGVEDGGKALLGVDVRDELWQGINRGNEIETFVDAYIELDPIELLSRIERRLSGPCEETLKARYLRVRGRIRGNESSQALINTLMHGDDYEAAIASYSGGSILNVAGFKTLQAAVSDENLSPQQRVRAMRTLAGSKSSGLVETLKQLAAKDSVAVAPLPQEAIIALGHIGNGSASSALAELFSEADDPAQQTQLLTALRSTRDPIARDHLIQEIVLRLPDDPLVPLVLDALLGKPFFEGTETIAELLKCEDPKVRAAAATAIGFSAKTVYGDRLVRLALDDGDRSVRNAALQSLGRQGNGQSIYQLATIFDDNSRDEDEKARVLATSVLIFERLHAARDAGLLAVLRRLLLAGLQKLRGVLAQEAVTHSHILGSEFLGRLVEICHDDEASDTIRVEACYSLARIMRYREHPLKPNVESGLLDLLRREPNAPPDEEQVNVNTRTRLAQAAADALTEINPETLLNEPGTTSRNALAAFSVRTGALVFTDRIISAHGKLIAGQAAAAEQSDQSSAGQAVISKPREKAIKILLLSANPTGTSTLKLDEETREIMAKIRASEHRDLFRIVIAGAVRPADLLQAMNEHQPHVVQFSGHGGEHGEGILICDESGNSKAINGESLAALFESTQKNVQVVVLNACYSQPQAQAVAAVVPCVIGLKDTIGDRAAFASSFYSALGFGHSVEIAFKQGLARLKLEGIPPRHIPNLITRTGVKASEIVLAEP